MSSYYKVRYAINGIDHGYRNIVRALDSQEAIAKVLRQRRWDNEDAKTNHTCQILSATPYTHAESAINIYAECPGDVAARDSL